MAQDIRSGNVPTGGPDVLAQVREGMAVYDPDGHHIGKVASLFMGAEADTLETGVIVERAAPGDPAVNVPIATMGDVLGAGADLPETVRNRMQQQGFIRVDMAGLLAGHRFALREHIASVGDDRVTLNVSRDGLIKL